jgi:hypothetical protein
MDNLIGQKHYHHIYTLAKKELPFKEYIFSKEKCIMYKGFKISQDKNGEFHFKDIRYSDHYEIVDPIISYKILSQGFKLTIDEVCTHNDRHKIVHLHREIEKQKVIVSHINEKRQKNYSRFRKEKAEVNRDKNLNELEKALKIDKYYEIYTNKSNLYKKRKRVRQEAIEELENTRRFYLSRILSSEGIKSKQVN